MGYIPPLPQIAAKRAIKELHKAVGQSQISQEAKYPKSVIEHYQRFGLASRLAAYAISRATVYNWQNRYQENGISTLTNDETRPHKK